MKKVIFTLFLLGVVAIAVYWTQHRQLLAVQTNLDSAQERVEQLQSTEKICRLENLALDLTQDIQAGKYPDSLKLSTEFFDEVRNVVIQQQQASYRPVLESILQTRDTVTAGLAKEDSGVLASISNSAAQLRQIIAQRSSAK
jgi:hypothetical protein